MNILEVRDLTKQYKNFCLSGIGFELPAGYIMGYVGRNGAGKTTTLNAITHLIRPDGGEAEVCGVRFRDDPVRYREMIGYIGDESFFPPSFTVKEVRSILKHFYPSFDGAAYDRYVQEWKLPEKEKIKNYSRGMKVKLMFASVLARETKLLILDEATNGLDPVMRRQILKILQDYISDGDRSVLFSTHIMEDLQDIADYVFFIEGGKKIFCETRDELLESYLIVKGSLGELTADQERAMIGLEKNAYGFSALLRSDDAAGMPAGFVTEVPTIDDIVVRMLTDGEGR